MAGVLTRGQIAAAVARAKLTGRLPQLDGSIACVDCSKPAVEYDHRDYSKPLDMEPVCRSCNVLRGKADNWIPRDDAFAMNLHLRIYDRTLARYLREQAQNNERSWSQQAAFMLKCAMVAATQQQG